MSYSIYVGVEPPAWPPRKAVARPEPVHVAHEVVKRLSRRQLSMLIELRRRDCPALRSDLVRETGFSRSSVSHALHALAREGLAEDVSEAGDRSCRWVATPEGRDFLRETK